MLRARGCDYGSDALAVRVPLVPHNRLLANRHMHTLAQPRCPPPPPPRAGIPVHVLSVNWSDVYVGAALSAAAGSSSSSSSGSSSGALPVRLAGEGEAAAAAAAAAGPAAVELLCNSLQVVTGGREDVEF